MKHSNWIKNLAFLTLILGIAFGGGFYFGAFPGLVEERLGIQARDLRWICVEEVCPSEQALLKIQEATQMKFQMIVAVKSVEDLKASSLRADIILAPRPMLLSIKTDLLPVTGISKDDLGLHPDFEAFVEKDEVGIPLFWHIVNPEEKPKKVRIFSLAYFVESRLTDAQRSLFLESLEKHEILVPWMKEKDLSGTTLGAENAPEVDQSHKPSYLRSLSLSEISIEE